MYMWLHVQVHVIVWLPMLDSMNTQLHDSPYELIFGQKPRPVVFGGVEGISMADEEELEVDGIIFEDMVRE